MRLHGSYLTHLLQNNIVPAYRKKELLYKNDTVTLSNDTSKKNLKLILNNKDFYLETRRLSYKSDREIAYWLARQVACSLVQYRRNNLLMRFKIMSVVGACFLPKLLINTRFV